MIMASDEGDDGGGWQRLSSAVYQRHMSGHPLIVDRPVSRRRRIRRPSLIVVAVFVGAGAHPGVGLDEVPFVAVAEDGVVDEEGALVDLPQGGGLRQPGQQVGFDVGQVAGWCG